MKRTFIALVMAVFVCTGVCCRVSSTASTHGSEPVAASASAKSIPENDIFTITSPGRWFPADAAELRRDVDGYIDGAQNKKLPGRITALISPHAGYVFSGPVAGWAYRQLQGLQFDTVVVVGFRHGPGFDQIATVTSGGFRTPLGVIPIDTDLAQALADASPLIQNTPQAFAEEHSLDAQLPFLQIALENFKLVPVLLCSQNAENIDALANALGQIMLGRNVLLVASTDMSHFWAHEQAKDLDQEALAPVLKMDAAALGKLMEADPTGRRMCGRGAVQVVMRAARALGADQATLLQYADSKDTAGYDDPERGVVGYAAVAFTDSHATNQKAEAALARQIESQAARPGYPGELDSQDQTALLKIARESLETFIRTGKPPAFSSNGPNLETKRGVFVTLKKDGELRGCMGHFENDTPLYEIVSRQTLISAVQDPRFPPVAPDELDSITIEISVLSAPEPVGSYEEIQVGRHGVIMRKNGRGATFLPQVAPEQGWTREEMLSQLSLKASLDQDAWKQGASFEIYTAQVFGER
jgi:hypothetical protein